MRSSIAADRVAWGSIPREFFASATFGWLRLGITAEKFDGGGSSGLEISREFFASASPLVEHNGAT